MVTGPPYSMPFNKNIIKEKELSIHIFRDGFSFCTHSTRLFFDVKSNPIKKDNAFKKLLEDNSLLDFQKVSCIYFNRPATFVPQSLYHSSKTENYLKHNVDHNSSLKITGDDSLNKEIKILYEIQEDKQKALKHYFRNISFSHYTKVLYDYLSKGVKGDAGTVFYLHMQNQQFEVMIFDGEQLSFYNSYPCKNEDDFLYFVLAIAEERALDSTGFSIVFLGKYDRYNSYYKALENYKEKLEYIDGIDSALFNLEQHPAPFFINIFD